MNNTTIVKKMTEVQSVLRRLAQLIEAAARLKTLSADDRSALERDRKFMASAIAALESNNPERINALWNDVQSLSRFFGGDYLRYSMAAELEELSELLFNGMLELVSEIRSQRGNGDGS